VVAAKVVLVIDDDVDFLEFARIVLESGGYRVLTATDAAQGLEIMRREQPDVVLLDVMMSYVLDGLNVIRQARGDPELKNTPIIVVTAVLSTEDMRDLPYARPEDCDAFMSKPVEPNELLRQIANLIRCKSERNRVNSEFEEET